MVVLIRLTIFLYKWRRYSPVLDKSCVRSGHFEILDLTEGWRLNTSWKISLGKYERFVVKCCKTIMIAVVFKKWQKWQKKAVGILKETL